MLDMAFPGDSQTNMGLKSFSGCWDFSANMGEHSGHHVKEPKNFFLSHILRPMRYKARQPPKS